MILYGIPSKIAQLPYSAAILDAILNYENAKRGHLYTRQILELHGPKHSKMQRNDCYQRFLGLVKNQASATGL